MALKDTRAFIEMQAVSRCDECPNHDRRMRLRNEEQGGNPHVCKVLCWGMVHGDAGKTVSARARMGEGRDVWEFFGLVFPDRIDSHCPLPRVRKVDQDYLTSLADEKLRRGE